MADPNEFGEQEMMGSFVEEGHEYQSGLGSEFSEDIKATAHFTQAQIYNLNRQNDFMENMDTSPVNRFQLTGENLNAIQHINDYSLQDSGYDNPQLFNSAGSGQQNNSQGYRNAESSGSIERPQVQQQQSSQQSPHVLLQQNGLQSSGRQPANSTEIKNQLEFSHHSAKSGGSQQFKQSARQQKSIEDNIQNSSVRKQPAQSSVNANSQEIRGIIISSPIQKVNEKSLSNSQSVRPTQQRRQQIIKTTQISSRNIDNRPINIQQAVFSQLMSQRTNNLQPLQRSSQSPTVGTKIVAAGQVIEVSSPSSNLNRYFPAVKPLDPNEKIKPTQLLGSPTNFKGIASLPQPQQVGRNRVVSPQGESSQIIKTGVYQPPSSIAATPYRGQPKPQTPVSGYYQHIQSSGREERPQVRPILQNSTSPPPKAINLSNQPQPQTGGRQSRIVGNENSGVVYGSRRSISYGSNDSKTKPTVYFTYTSNVSHAGLAESKSQVIREHTHTVIQKTTTVVWVHRYLTLIEKFHVVSERFALVVKQLVIVTGLLEGAKGKQNMDSFYRDLLLRHTRLLEMLSQCQNEMSKFEEDTSWFNKQIQYDIDLKEQTLFKDKYQQLQYENSKLKEQLSRLADQSKIARPQSAQFPSQAQTMQMEVKIQKLQEELRKSEAVGGQLQQYIAKLEHDYNSMSEELGRLRGGENAMVEYVNLIKNQQLIIRQLEEELKKKPKEQNAKKQPIQQYVRAISELETKVHQLEQSSLQSEKKYAQIIENQRGFIENLDQHLKEMEKGAATREGELSNALKDRQSTIATLEEQLRNARGNTIGVTKQREQALLEQLENHRTKIKELSIQLQSLVQKNNIIRSELESKTTEVSILKEQRLIYQRSVEQKLEQKLFSIEQQLRQRGSETPRAQPSTPRVQRNQQVQQLMQENDRLVSQMRKKHQEKRKLEEQLINQDENMRRKLLEKQSQIRLLNDKVKLVEEENKRRFSEKDRKIKQLEDEIDSLTIKVKSNVSTPRNQQSSQNFESYSPAPANNQQIRSLKDRISQKEQEVLEIQRQKDNVEKKFQTLQVNFNSVDEENVKKTQQLMNLKRQISNLSTFDNEIKTLTETVSKKNQQILELKSVSFEKNQLKIELESIKNERNNLKATIQSKAQEIEKLKQTINEFEAKIRQSKNRQSLFPTTTNQSAVEELQIMYESMKKKEAELIKIKQANQLLETNVQELEYQLERAKAKIVTLQKNHLHDKEDNQNRVAEYQKVIKELQAKTKSLDQSQRMNKTNFNVELQNLDNVLKEKQEAVRKLEGQNKVLKNKLKNHDSKTQDYQSEIQNLNKKVKEIEAARDQLKKQIEVSQSGNQHNNKKLYDEYQIKIVQLEASIKVKDNKIKQLENNFETLKMKTSNQNQAEEEFINQQQIEVLRKKVAEYQSRLYNFGGSRINNIKPRDYESTLVFEQKAIYDLKAQNERLRSLISSKSLKQPSADTSPQKPNVEFIQKRLLDFNQRLEEMIEQNRNLEEKNSEFATFLQPRHQNQQIMSSFQRERATLLKKHRGEISGLQARLIDLQRYCSTLEFMPNNTSTYSYTSNTKYLDSAKTVYAEQLNYYKEKNKELEERIDEHIKINKDLKQKLEGALRSGADVNAVEFYRMQISQMEREISQYLLKIKSLNQESSKLKLTLESHKNDQSSQLKISELENRIHELNRKIAQLQMQNGIFQSDLQKYIHELKLSTDQSQKHRTNAHQKDQKLNSLDQALRDAQSKINNYEIQVVKLTNQIKLLEAEAERLSEKTKNKQVDENNEISRLKARILQLQTQLRQYEEHSNVWNEAKASYEQTISTLNTRITNLEAEVSRLNALYVNLSKKAKDSDGESFDLQNRLQNQRNRANELQILLDRKQTEIDSMNQFLERIKKERDNEGTQSKQRLAYISEMQETIRSLKAQISQYKAQLERLRTENSENRQRLSVLGNLDEVVKQLRLEVQLHKGEIERLKNANEQLRQRAGSSAQVEQDNLRYLTEIQRMKKEEQRLQSQLSKLRIYVEKLERELRASQQLTDKIAYRLEFIRSIFIQMEVLSDNLLVDQSNRRQVQLLDKFNSSLGKGLNMCSQTFAIL